MDDTLRERSNPQAGDGTLRDPVAGPASLFPGGLFLGYTLLKPIPVSSGEADLWFVRKDGVEQVLKLYRYGMEPKADLTEKLRSLAGEHVVRLEEHGRFGNRSYEILEKVEHGDLRQLGRPLAEPRLQEVLRELAAAVQHLHQEGILHRDLKPANVLVRRREPLDLVLTDFGIASLSEATVHLTSAHRTASYSAPEALTGVVSAASDWWSVGVMVLELLKGVHPLAGLSEQVINFQLVSKGIRVPEDVPPEWAELLKGLLTRDHDRRWGAEQVNRWLQGEQGQATQYEDDRPQDHRHQPYLFGGKECFTARELAVALSGDWENGVRNFGRGFVAEWVKAELKNYDLASRLLDMVEQGDWTGDEKLSVALTLLDPGWPAVWRGNVVNREWAARDPDAFLELWDSRVRARLEKQPGWPVEIADGLRQLEDPGLGRVELAGLRRLVLNGDPVLRLGPWVVTPESLVERGEESIRLLEGRVPEWHGRLTGQPWLREAAERWRTVWPQVERLGCGTPPGAALRWLAGNPRELEARAGELLSRYAGSRQEAVNALWAIPQWGMAECTVLCAADATQLQTAAQRRMAQSLRDEAARRSREQAEEARLAKDLQEAAVEMLRKDGEGRRARRRVAQAVVFVAIVAAVAAALWRQWSAPAAAANARESAGGTALPGPTISGAERKPGERHEFGGIPVRWIPAGRFLMGSPESEEGRDWDERQHEVTLTRGFFMAETECTQAQWEAVMGSNPSGFKGPARPVEKVSWFAAIDFCRKLTQQQQERSQLPKGWEWRLPTEAEWEYAARAGTMGPRDGELDAIAWHTLNSGMATVLVGQKLPNAWGLSDMLGNVCEWCEDSFGEYLSGSAEDPRGPDLGELRVLRGASWADLGVYYRLASRDNASPFDSGHKVGFRPVLAHRRTESPAKRYTVDDSVDITSDKWARNQLESPSKSPGERLQVGQVAVRWIPPGRFVMGSPGSEEGRGWDERQHEVVLPRGFFMAETECTQAQWESVMGNNPSGFKGSGLPVERVTRDEAVDFCGRLTRQQRQRGLLPAGWEWRLPAEAEWEYAARAQSTGTSYGDLDAIAWHKANAGQKTSPVKQKTPNKWGLYDILGNVCEWCAGAWDEYEAEPVRDSVGFKQPAVARGGSWQEGETKTRTAERITISSNARMNDLGFRPVLAPAQP